MSSHQKRTPRERRKLSIRKNLSGTTERPRMSVFRSNKHIYVQVIDDSTGKTIASASTLSPELKGKVEGDKKDAAKAVGELAAQGVDTFCLSLDPKADDYVQGIFGKRHLVLDRVEQLPEKLPLLYMALTK